MAPTTSKVLRFAHPFFTNVPPQERAIRGPKRAVDFVKTKLQPIPNPRRDPTMQLADVIGSQGVTEVAAAGKLIFHSVGDTGHAGSEIQEYVGELMGRDYNPSNPGSSPSFLLHLGDVIYYDNTPQGYQSQFYVQYKNYPGKIIAIPGNHDGELFKYNQDGQPSTGQKKTLEAFRRNFCQPQPGIPADAGTIYREMISQPGVYWYLNTPFADIVGLYSNVGEGPGFISGGAAGTKQKAWLNKTLKAIRTARGNGSRKALVIAVHHPPFSMGGHDSSEDMLNDIDDSCTTSGVMPDAILSAHAHNYQRFTWYRSFGGKDMQIPVFVVGTGGRNVTAIKKADGVRQGEKSFDSSLKGYGFLTVEASREELSLYFTQVFEDKTKKPFDKKVVVNLATNKIKTVGQ